MDRCRCDEYAAAVKKLRFYTVGTYSPDIIDNYDKGDYYAVWERNNVDHVDLKFSKPKGHRKLKPEELPKNVKENRSRQVEMMWCPYLTPYGNK